MQPKNKDREKRPVTNIPSGGVERACRIKHLGPKTFSISTIAAKTTPWSPQGADGGRFNSVSGSPERPVVRSRSARAGLKPSAETYMMSKADKNKGASHTGLTFIVRMDSTATPEHPPTTTITAIHHHHGAVSHRPVSGPTKVLSDLLCSVGFSCAVLPQRQKPRPFLF